MNIKILSLIKTPCGRAKYKELQSRQGLIAKIRLYWFVIVAMIKDWNLKEENQPNESES